MWSKFLVLSLSGSFVAICILKRYYGGQSCNCKQRLDGKVIIVTGANSGIGKETATILALKGAEVVLACRDEVKGEKTAADIRRKTGNESVRCEKLDLSRIKSIFDFVNRFRDRGTKLYALLNNAGVFHVPFQLTEDGFDLTLQVNYIGPFLLTYLLLDKLTDSAPSRIVNIGSESHWYPTSLDVSKLTKYYTKVEEFDRFMFYGTTKLCLMLFTTKLAKSLKGSGVTVNSVNPGNVRSNIHRHFPAIRNLPLFSVNRFVLWLTFKTPRQGAQTSVHLLTDPALADTSGKYFSDCAVRDVSSLAKSSTLEKELWKATLRWLQPYINYNVRSKRGVEL